MEISQKCLSHRSSLTHASWLILLVDDEEVKDKGNSNRGDSNEVFWAWIYDQGSDAKEKRQYHNQNCHWQRRLQKDNTDEFGIIIRFIIYVMSTLQHYALPKLVSDARILKMLTLKGRGASFLVFLRIKTETIANP